MGWQTGRPAIRRSLNDEQVMLLRRCRENEDMSPNELYELFGVLWNINRSTIKQAVNGYSYKHLSLPDYPPLTGKTWSRALTREKYVESVVRGGINKEDHLFEWPYARKSDGRPRVLKMAAVRYAWFILYGEFPSGQLNHIRGCNDARCWNPHHVYDGTKRENALDYYATKGEVV